MIENTYGSSNASQPTATHTHTLMLTDNQLCSRMQVSNIYVYVCKSPGCFLLRAHSGIYLVKMTKTNKNGISLTNKMDFYCLRYCFTVFYTIFRTVIVIFIYSYIYLFFISFGLLSFFICLLIPFHFVVLQLSFALLYWLPSGVVVGGGAIFGLPTKIHTNMWVYMYICVARYTC